jgi:DNA-binding NarL/FixJ family response regulator
VLAHETSAPRVLLGDLDPITLIGMRRSLAQDGVEVLAEEGSPERIVAQARRLAPDAVVLGLDGRRSRRLGRLVRAAAPRTTVILLASDESEIQVLDRGGRMSRRIRTRLPEALLFELGVSNAGDERK